MFTQPKTTLKHLHLGSTEEKVDKQDINPMKHGMIYASYNTGGSCFSPPPPPSISKTIHDLKNKNLYIYVTNCFLSNCEKNLLKYILINSH